MLIAKLIWIHIFLMLSICIFNSNSVYPVPGSYYSVLLRYNNRGKNRKGARVGPSPLRLWAYFDPPSVLGSLALGSIDNNLEVHNRKRSVWASQERVKKTNEEGVPTVKDAETTVDQTKSSEISPFLEGAKRVEIGNIPRPLDTIQKDNRKLEVTEMATIESSCGGNEKVVLDPYNYVPDSEGRFFYKIIQTIGYPHFYEPQSKCIWNFQFGRECQMGMIIVEFLEGTLIDSPQCQMDSINILFNGESKKKICGSMSGVITSLKWTKTGKQLVQVALESKSEKTTFAPGHEWGAKVSLSGYCWVYAPHFLTQSLAAIKEKENSKKYPDKVSEDGDQNSQNKIESDINTPDKGNKTVETLKLNAGSTIKATTEYDYLTTVSAMDIDTDETLEPKSEYETTDKSIELKNEYETTDETLDGLEPKSELSTIETFIKSDSELMTTLLPSRSETDNEMLAINNAI